MKKYIISLLITLFLVGILDWALSLTTWSGFVCGLIQGAFGMFVLDVCLEAFTYAYDDDDDNDDIGDMQAPYPAH